MSENLSAIPLTTSPPVAYVGHMILLTTKDAAALVGVPVRTFNRWVTAGLVPVATQAPGVNGARFFDANAIGELVKARAS